jgi:hypothetical protein
MGIEDGAAIAGPLLMVAGILGGNEAESLLRDLGDSSLAPRAQLVRVAAIIAGAAADIALNGCLPTLAKLKAGMTLDQLTPEERAELEEWSRGLKPACDVQRFTAWAVNTEFSLPLSEDVANPRAFDLPKRIGVLTMRSLSPAREETAEPDDGA